MYRPRANADAKISVAFRNAKNLRTIFAFVLHFGFEERGKGAERREEVGSMLR